jgi:hypothetical protein
MVIILEKRAVITRKINADDWTNTYVPLGLYEQHVQSSPP